MSTHGWSSCKEIDHEELRRSACAHRSTQSPSRSLVEVKCTVSTCTSFMRRQTVNLSSYSSVLPRNCSTVQCNKMLAWLPNSKSTTTCSISEATLGFEACQPWLGTWMTWEEILITNPEAVPARKVVIHIPCQNHGPPWCTKNLPEFLKFCI